MIGALAILFGFQLLGELIVRAVAFPFPGPVLGMVLLFVALELRGSVSPALRETAQNLLKHLTLLFVPAAVGVMSHAALLRAEWLPIVASLVVGTLITLAVTALSTCFLLRRAPTPPARRAGRAK